MNRATALIIAAIALLTGGWLFWQSREAPSPADVPPADAPPAETAPDPVDDGGQEGAPAPANGAAEQSGDAQTDAEAGDGQEGDAGLGEALEGTLEAIGGAAEGGLAPPEMSGDDPAAPIDEAVEGTIPEPQTSPRDAIDAPGEASEGEGSGATEDAAPGGIDPAALSTGEFDRDAAMAALEAADLPAERKAALREALAAVPQGATPAPELLERLRTALGL